MMNDYSLPMLAECDVLLITSVMAMEMGIMEMESGYGDGVVAAVDGNGGDGCEGSLVGPSGLYCKIFTPNQHVRLSVFYCEMSHHLATLSLRLSPT